ncbi:MAG: hypothetical protein QM612_02515 [Thermomonas sp.]|uniref:hypothetical protein n=1 Tax=Thermomonas sp. TaxID=1971895 RepID=UPI0039E6E8D9
MTQLHCYVPDDVAKRLNDKAKQAGMPVSRYLAALIRKDTETGWPEGYFDLFGAWEGEPLVRPTQDILEPGDCVRFDG